MVTLPRAADARRRCRDQLALDVVESLHALLQRATRMSQAPRDQIQALAPVRRASCRQCECNEIVSRAARRCQSRMFGAISSAPADGVGRAHVGDEVADRDIGFVTDRGHDRNRTTRPPRAQRFEIESPQVFERAAAAREQHDVRFARRTRPANRPPRSSASQNLRFGVLSLHRNVAAT